MTDTSNTKPVTPPKSVKIKPRRKGYTSCMLGLTLGLLGLIAGRLGNLWVAFDVFSQFTLQFGFASLAFFIALFSPRAKTFMALLMLVLFGLAYGMWPHYLNRSEQVATAPLATEKALKVLSFNTHESNKNIAAALAEIQRIDADLVTLLEFSPDKTQVLESLKSLYPYQYNCFENPHCNLAVISKTPISDFEAQLIWEGPPYVRVSLGADYNNLAVYAVHTTRFPHSRAQLKQITALAARMEKETVAILAMGDFNATPHSRVTKTMVERLGLVRHTNLPTWPAALGIPQLAIDHIFTSPTIRALSEQRIGNAAGSDHFPITMTLAIPSK